MEYVIGEKMNVILGAGIAGLISHWYHKDYTIISKDVGGQLGLDFAQGPRFLHKDEYSEKFLRDLLIPLRERIVHVGYYFDGKINEKFPFELKMKYAEKTRGEHGKTEQAAMNRGEQMFWAYEVDWNKILEKLTKDTKVILDAVSSIDLIEKKIYCEKSTYKYDKLITTIPAPIFFNLCNLKVGNFVAKSITFVLAETDGDILSNTKFDFVYFLNDEFKFNRITKVDDNKRVYEFIDANEVVTERLLPNTRILKWHTEQMGKIASNVSLPMIENVTTVGRWAQWDSNVLTNDVIHRVLVNT
jgi:hypothetical protein